MFWTVPLSIIRSFGQFLCPSSGVLDSSSVHHQEFFTADTVMVYVTQELSSILILLASCQQTSDIYHFYVYSEKLLMMDRGTV